MKKPGWKTRLGIELLIISALLYGVHYLVFKDPYYMSFYLLQDIAFVPIEVLLVTLIISEVLSIREKRAMSEKMNMVIGTFFNAMGTELLGRLATFDVDATRTYEDLLIKGNWSERDFASASDRVKGYNLRLETERGDLEEMRRFMVNKRDFLLRMLENPTLLERDTFTDLLWAVFHLSDELAHRQSVDQLPEADRSHLSLDMKRAYAQLILEWIQYMRHLKDAYPYLFSLAVRTNPFDGDASVVLADNEPSSVVPASNR